MSLPSARLSARRALPPGHRSTAWRGLAKVRRQLRGETRFAESELVCRGGRPRAQDLPTAPSQVPRVRQRLLLLAALPGAPPRRLARGPGRERRGAGQRGGPRGRGAFRVGRGPGGGGASGTRRAVPCRAWGRRGRFSRGKMLDGKPPAAGPHACIARHQGRLIQKGKKRGREARLILHGCKGSGTIPASVACAPDRASPRGLGGAGGGSRARGGLLPPAGSGPALARASEAHPGLRGGGVRFP